MQKNLNEIPLSCRRSISLERFDLSVCLSALLIQHIQPIQLIPLINSTFVLPTSRKIIQKG